MEKPKYTPLTTMQVERETLQKMRVVASLEGMRLSEWVGWMVDRAYQSKMRKKDARTASATGRGA